MAAAVYTYKGAALAPMAPPSAPVQPAIRNPVAEPAASPLAPYGLPVGFIAGAGTPPGVDVFNPLAPTARELPGLPEGGGRELVLPGGPNLSIQFNLGDNFAGTDNFTYDPSGQNLFLNGNAYLTGAGGGTVSASGGAMNLGGYGALTLFSNTGNINFNLPTSSFIVFPGVTFGNVSITYNSQNIRQFGGQFQIANFAGDMVYMRVNALGNSPSPLNFKGLPLSPAGLQDGDIWISGGMLAIIGGTAREEPPPPPPRKSKGKTKRAIRAVRHLAGSLVIATGGMVSRLVRRARLSTGL